MPKKKVKDLTLSEAKKYCDDKAKEKDGVYCIDCPLANICGDYLDGFDDEDLNQEIEVEE